MGTSTEQRSPVMRFLDAFLQEENIKWMLGAGVCILLGSSLRLVTMHWNECTPVWKYLILVSYTGTVFLLSEFCYHRLGLRKTGTVLMALTVLLIPLSFLALHWVRPQHAEPAMGLVLNTGLTVLLGINIVWSTFAAHRIFCHFLRRVQPTFLICYLMMCVSGAVLPGLPVAWSPILALFLWAVFAVGSIKVNRHVFWLTEEHRLPRIFGFFPILLLGAQFGAVFTFGLASHLTLAWIGLLCTLISLPILLTADMVARVFERRTGGLIRPIPWSIIGPLVLGTMLCVAGVVLSLTGWPGSGAAVPAAAVAALALAIVGHRTQKSAFVWGMVFCVMTTYQTLPVFFKELVLQLRDQAAAAVHESRLPFAFYGLTYAPLVLTFSLVAWILQRRGDSLFSKPLRQTACTLPWILFVASLTHPSAILPVSLILSPIFLGQAALFQRRQLLIPSAIAFLAAAYGLPVFCDRVFDCPVSNEMALLIWTVAAGLLFVPGFLVDRWSRSFDCPAIGPDQSGWTQYTCQFFSLVSTLAASVFWIVRFTSHSKLWESDFSVLISVVLAILLASHVLRWLKPGLGEWSLLFSTYLAVRLVTLEHATSEACFSTLCLLLLAQWFASYGIEFWRESRIAKAFARPLLDVSLFGMSILFALFLCDWVFVHTGFKLMTWTTAFFVLIWGLDAARRLRQSVFTTIAWCSVFVFCSASVTASFGFGVVQPWWLAIWATVGLSLLLVRQSLYGILGLREDGLSNSESDKTTTPYLAIADWLSPLNVVIPAAFVIIAVANLLFLDWPLRIAGILALGGLFAVHRCRVWPNAMMLFWPLLNWTLLALFTTANVVTRNSIFDLTAAEFQSFGLPLAAFAAISLWCFEFKRPRDWVLNTELIVAHQSLLFAMSLLLLGGALQWHSTGTWEWVQIVWAAVSWLSIAGALLTNAVRTQVRDAVWWAEGTLLVAFAYFNLAGFWELTGLMSMSLVLMGGITFWSIGIAVKKSERFAILSIPFRQTGFWLPLVVVPLALWRHFNEPAADWAGSNSLPLLGAATFYFWRGMERRQIETTILSAVILNLATSLLWSELHWSDPQLFLIPIGISVLALTELLNREIPAKHHEELRLVGSLLILVSPTFHIVTGSWLHILTLMIASVAIALIAIGLRVRILLYTSTAFLLADLVALVARGSIDHPNLLWIVGVGIGASVIALGAICENHRELLLGRLRGLAAELELWS